MLANKFVIGVYLSEFLYYKQHVTYKYLIDYTFPGAPNSEFMYTYL